MKFKTEELQIGRKVKISNNSGMSYFSTIKQITPSLIKTGKGDFRRADGIEKNANGITEDYLPSYIFKIELI